MTARVSGFLIFLPPTWFKYFHLAHHRFTQIPGKDPELAFEKPKTVLGYIIHVSGFTTWIGHFKTLFRNATNNCKADFLPQKAEARIVRESRLLLLVYVMILSGNIFWMSAELFWIWLLPVLLGQPFLRFYLLAEHGLCPTVANMFENTRTTFTNSIVRFVAWNMPYHTEHHVYPMVPFHKLPELHEIIQNDLIHKEASYTVFTGRYIGGLKDNNYHG
jgi:fatty acid desaturase